MISTAFSALVNHLWQSTLFVAAVWLLTLALRKNRAAVRYGVWFAGSVKFLVPFSLLVSLGGQFGWRSAPAIERPHVAAVITELSRSLSVPAGISPLMSGSNHGSELSVALFVVWLCGILLGLIFWTRLLRRIRTVRNKAKPLDLNLPIPVLSSPSRLEPGVFGILKPVLILPAGITERLTPAQFQAVLAHELCHVRRRDNLTAAVHMLVETIFWFHPAAWWIRAQLIRERERACDEQVIHAFNDPQVYAEGILNVCKLYVESRLACVSGITGGDLKRRIQRIMSRTAVCGLGWTKKALLVAAGAIAVVAPLMVGLVSAPRSRAQSQSQTQSAALTFEVASIKPNKSMTQDFSLNRTPGGGLEMINGTTRTLVKFAYGLPDYQLSGIPEWFDTERYDVIAKAPAGTKIPNPERPWLVADDDPIHSRIQNLLAERFHLAVHRETREMPVVALVQDKAGAKLQSWKEGDLPGPSMHVDRTNTRLTCRQYSMQRFATAILSERLGMPVIDKTGLTGEYNFVMTFQPDPPPPRPGTPPEAAAGPTFVEALRDQLGLKLERQKGPVNILVIDHAEKPDPN